MGATVADAYMAFGQTLLLVAVLGLALSSKRLGIGQRAMDRAGALVTVVGLMTSAALLSVAFLGGRLSEQGALQPISGDFGTASGLTVQVLFTGGSGLLCMLVGATILSSVRTRRWSSPTYPATRRHSSGRLALPGATPDTDLAADGDAHTNPL